jgi:O-antigen/teichoic acid export membrane protein
MSDDSLSIGELRAATLRGLRWAVISRPIIELLSMGSMIVLARLIAPAEFGRYAIALIVFDLGSVSGQGVGVALVQRRSIEREHLQAGFALALLSGLALVLLIVAAAQFVVAPIYGERTAELVRYIAPLSFLTAASMVPTAMLQRGLEFKRLSTLSVVSTVVTAMTSVPLAIAGMQGVALILGLLAGSVVSTAILWFWASPPPPRLRRGPANDLLSYGGPAALAAVGWVGFRNCDYAIVGARLGALSAGYYYRAYTLAVEYQKKITQLIGTLGFPLLSRASSPDDQSLLRSKMVRLETLVLFPMLVLLAIVAPILIPWFFGSEWEPAVVPTQILALGGAATLVIDAVGAALMASGRPRAILGYGWGHFACYAGAVVLVAPLGITAIAIAAATVHSAFVIVAYYLLLQGRESGPVGRLWASCREFAHDVAPATLSCLALTAVSVPVSVALSSAHIGGLVYLVAVSVVGAVAYLVALKVFYADSFRSLWRLVGHLLPESSRLRGLSRRLAPTGSQAATESP